MRRWWWKLDSRGLLSGVAGILAAAAHTTFPAASIVAAVLSVSRVQHVEDWRQRLVAEITNWVKAHGTQWAVTTEVPSDFEESLFAALSERGMAELDPGDPQLRAVLVDALTASVFVPLVDLPNARANAKAAAEALVDVLPELLVRSAPDDTPLAPLRDVIGKDIAEVSQKQMAELGLLRAELAVGLAAASAGHAADRDR